MANITINGFAFEVNDAFALTLMQMCMQAGAQASVSAPTPTPTPAPTPVVSAPTPTYKACTRTDGEYTFALKDVNGGVTPVGSDGKFIHYSAIRKACNAHIKSAGYTWDAEAKAYKGGRREDVVLTVTQEEVNRMADRIDARNARKYGA